MLDAFCRRLTSGRGAAGGGGGAVESTDFFRDGVNLMHNVLQTARCWTRRCWRRWRRCAACSCRGWRSTTRASWCRRPRWTPPQAPSQSAGENLM